MLFLVSCVKQTKQPEYPLLCSGMVVAEYKGFSCSANVDFDGNKMDIIMDSPEILKGLELTVTADEVRIKNDSLNFDYEKGIIDDFCPITYLFDVLVTANSLKTEFFQQDDVLLTQFDFENHDCEIRINKETGKIVEVKYDEYILGFEA